MKFLVLVLFALFIGNVVALEIDEKLTLRIVNTSVSKKTILINRGIEDGLAKGDHAKFFVSTGVIGRGVCIKLSPTRSVWSVYRLVNADFLREDQVMKLKITPAVKITKDESRMLVKDDAAIAPKDPRDLGIPLAEGADDIDLARQAPKVSDSLLTPIQNTSLLNRNREVFGMIHYSSSRETSSPSKGTEYSNDVTNLLIKIGGEWYFRGESKWYERFSFSGIFVIDRKAIMGYLGTFVKEESSEFGLGVSMYPGARPSQVHKIIQFLNYTLGFGSTNSSYVHGGENESADPGDSSLDASVISHTFTYGLKYYTSAGFGGRLELSFITRGEDFTEDAFNTSFVKTEIGPRLLVGLGYRF